MTQYQIPKVSDEELAAIIADPTPYYVVDRLALDLRDARALLAECREKIEAPVVAEPSEDDNAIADRVVRRAEAELWSFARKCIIAGVDLTAGRTTNIEPLSALIDAKASELAGNGSIEGGGDMKGPRGDTPEDRQPPATPSDLDSQPPAVSSPPVSSAPRLECDRCGRITVSGAFRLGEECLHCSGWGHFRLVTPATPSSAAPAAMRTGCVLDPSAGRDAPETHLTFKAPTQRAVPSSGGPAETPRVSDEELAAIIADPKPHYVVDLLALDLRDTRARIATLEADVVAASGELLIPAPEPGTDMGRMMIANRLLMRERDRLTAERDRLTAQVESARLAVEAEREENRLMKELASRLTAERDRLIEENARYREALERVRSHARSDVWSEPQSREFVLTHARRALSSPPPTEEGRNG